MQLRVHGGTEEYIINRRQNSFMHHDSEFGRKGKGVTESILAADRGVQKWCLDYGAFVEGIR